MSEPIEATIESLTAELEVLRKTNSELLKKIHDRTTKATELESTVSELQGKLTESATAIHGLTVTAPLKAMAASVSTDPDFFLEQFAKAHKVEMVEGKLSLQTTDGRLVTKDGKAIPFERDAIVKMLTDMEGTQGKVFRSILIGSLASGANGGASSNQGSNRTSNATTPKPNFGIR